MNKTDCLIVLQTHSCGNNPVVKEKERYCGAPKNEVMFRCVHSLVRSINHAASAIEEISFRLKVFDDHSDDLSLQNLATVLRKARFEASLESLQDRGLMNSMLKCYEYGRDQGKGLVYFVQDDYLYFDSAIHDMCYAFNDFSGALGNLVGVFPYDDPYRYQPQNSWEMLRLVHGRTRHWRTTLRTPSCFMIHYAMLMKNWDLFYQMATSEISAIMEDVSINRLWTERGYYCFSPIPSLALHMGYASEKDPYIRWQELWENNNPASDTSF
ncbi:MAG: hypothetical protein ABL921_20490 [Pirellula sp.]